MQKLLILCVLVSGLVLTLGFGSLPAHSAGETSALLAAMQQKYESIQTFRAHFTQVLTNTASREKERRSGRVALKKPRHIRWETLEPEKELLVASEDVVWDYFAEEQTAYKYHAAEILDSKTMLHFLDGTARLDKDFEVVNAGQEEGLTRLDLTPKEPEPGLVQASVWVHPTSYLIERISMVDFYGNENLVAFSGTVLNPPLDDALFSFTPPEGVDVFDNTKDISSLGITSPQLPEHTLQN